MRDSHDDEIAVGDHVVFDSGDDPETPWLKHGRVTALDEGTVTIDTAERGEVVHDQERLLTGPEGFIMLAPALTSA